jgi:hypothetical protein
MLRRVILAVALVLLWPAAAVVNAEPKQGNFDFTLSGSGTSSAHFDATSVSATGGIGFFLLSFLCVGARQDIGYSDTATGKDWIASTRGFIDIHIPIAFLDPFIGANFGYVYGDKDVVEDSFVAGPEAGLRVYLKDDAFLYGMVEYQVLFEDSQEAEDNYKDGRFVYSIGFGLNF